MVEEVTDATVRQIEAHLCSKYGMSVMPKGGPVWDAVGVGFDFAHKISGSVPTGKDFNDRFTTTVAKIIFRARSPMPPSSWLEVLTHEVVHGTQFDADGPKMLVWYLQHREKRAAYEAAAYATSYALRWLLTHELPSSPAELPGSLVYAYALKAEDIELARGLLEAEVTSLSHGVLPMGPVREVLQQLNLLQPGALHPDSVRAVRAVSPTLLP